MLRDNVLMVFDIVQEEKVESLWQLVLPVNAIKDHLSVQALPDRVIMVDKYGSQRAGGK